MLQRLSSLFYLGAALLLLTLAACDFVAGGEQSGLLTPTAVLLPQDGTPEPVGSGDGLLPITVTQEILEPPVVPLKIWVPADPPGFIDEAADTFVAKLTAFANSPAELETVVQKKALSGPGGILSYLRTGRGVAEAALPDLVILPAKQLQTAVTDGLIYPLDEFVDREAVLGQLYPAAAEMAQLNGQLVGYPFALTNLTHIAYDPTVVTQTIPLRWTEFISTTNRSLILPAASSEAAILAFQLYQSFGGTLAGEAGQSPLQLEPLTNALLLLTRARAGQNLIVVDSLNTITFDQAWEGFRNGSASMVLTSAAAYWPHQAVEPQPLFSAIPGPELGLPPLVEGWVIVLTAPEQRRAAAAEFLRSVVSAPNLAEWSSEQLLLPASRDALALWHEDDAYLAFLQAQLDQAQPNPLLLDSGLMVALQNAAFDVLSLAQPPEAAALQAIEATTP